MATYSAEAHVDKVDGVQRVRDFHQTDRKKCAFVCLSAIPSPDSEDFVGEGEGRFPLGGLSDTTDSLEKKKKHI